MNKLWQRISKIGVTLGTIGVLVVTPASSSYVDPKPTLTLATSIASLGDSVTQAANACEPWQNCPDVSWSTGLDEKIISHATELKKLQPEPEKFKIYNNAQSFTKVEDLPRQTSLAISQKVEYVTILSGANDICTPTVEEMTTPESFRSSIETTFSLLEEKLPLTKIFVGSIPNIPYLWNLMKDDPKIVKKWVGGDICQSMFNPNPEGLEERQAAVQQRIIVFNRILAEVCADYADVCVSDNNAVYKHKFTVDELSVVDSFHPSIAGQQMLSSLTWEQIPGGFLRINRGISSKGIIGEVPVVKIVAPKQNDVVEGQYDIRVYVKSDRKLKEVYLETQIGNFELYQIDDTTWKITVDTTYVPDGTKTSFRAVAIDNKNNVGVSERVKAEVDNSEYVPPTPTLTPESPEVVPENKSGTTSDVDKNIQDMINSGKKSP